MLERNPNLNPNLNPNPNPDPIYFNPDPDSDPDPDPNPNPNPRSAALLELPEMLATRSEKSTAVSIDELAKDSSGMDFEEFEAVITEKQVPIARPQLRMLFNMHDADGSGTIDGGEVDMLIKEMRILFPEMDSEAEKQEAVFEVNTSFSQKSVTSNF